MREKQKICVITSPKPKAGIIPVSNIIDILTPLAEELYLLTGNEGLEVLKTHNSLKGCSYSYFPTTSLLSKLYHYITLQLRMSFAILKLIKNVEVWIFFMAEGLFFPMLTLKIFNKNILLCLGACSPQIIDSNNNLPFIYKALKFFELANYSLSNKLILYSSNLIKEWNLEKYKSKILISREHFVDFSRFKLSVNFSQRGDSIGYIGRFSEEKGVINFVESIPLILKQKPHLSIFLMGDGDLKSDVEKRISESGLKEKIKLTGWVSHEDLPKYLNFLKLLVMPSYTEGLPNTMLEAMACGTPVLATKVGAIPDIIEDTRTGFLMENNSPECIANNIIRALEHPDLQKIAKDAGSFVKHEFTYEAAIEKYSSVFR